MIDSAESETLTTWTYPQLDFELIWDPHVQFFVEVPLE